MLDVDVDGNYKLEKLKILEQKAKLADGLPHLYGLKFYKWQYDYWHTTAKYRFLNAANQIGKMVLLNELIPTPNGFVEAGSVSVGDKIFGSDGVETTVVAIPYRGTRPCYKVTFDDGSNITVGKEHLWKCKTYKERFRKRYTSLDKEWNNPSHDEWVVKSTEEIISAGKYSPLPKNNGTKVSIPVCKPVQYRSVDLPVDPYRLGAMLGDGCLSTMAFGCADREILDRMNIGHSLEFEKYSGKDYRSFRLKPEDSKAMMEVCGSCSSADKYIDDRYLHGSVEQRLELLKGLMDTDGSVYGKGTLEFCTVSEKLRDGFIELVNSLGGIVNSCTTKKPFYYNESREKVLCKDAYSIRFKIKVNPFYVKRKADKFRPDTRYRHERLIESVEYVGEMDGVCFTVDNSDSTFIASKSYIVTHNSTIQIRKCIDIATNPELWNIMWPEACAANSHFKPVIWYLYPNQDNVKEEFEEKWIKEFMPRGEYEDHPIYGWKKIVENKILKGVKFNTGVTVYYKTYSQNVEDLQSRSVHIIFCDEELPEALFSELRSRLIATQGYFSMVFTATLGQDIWRRTMQPEPDEKELFTEDTFKRQVSMYDCLKYVDGSNTGWTVERIKREIAACKNKAEIQRRIFGKFVKDTGKKFYAFDRESHYIPFPSKNGVPYRGVPIGYSVYSGVDWGSGGEKGHPSAFVFVSADKTYTKLRVFRGQRLDKIQTTCGDLYSYYVKSRGSLKVDRQVYDFAASDFGVISQRSGDTFFRADKSRDTGHELINSLFKLGILKIYKDPELEKLVREIENASDSGKKIDDDFIDALRYAIMSIPVDWKKIFDDLSNNPDHKEVDKMSDMLREFRPRDYEEQERLIMNEGYDEEFAEWNDLY